MTVVTRRHAVNASSRVLVANVWRFSPRPPSGGPPTEGGGRRRAPGGRPGGPRGRSRAPGDRTPAAGGCPGFAEPPEAFIRRFSPGTCRERWADLRLCVFEAGFGAILPSPSGYREGMDARPMDRALRGRKTGDTSPLSPIASRPSIQAAAPAEMRSEAEFFRSSATAESPRNPPVGCSLTRFLV